MVIEAVKENHKFLLVPLLVQKRKLENYDGIDTLISYHLTLVSIEQKKYTYKYIAQEQ